MNQISLPLATGKQKSYKWAGLTLFKTIAEELQLAYPKVLNVGSKLPCVTSQKYAKEYFTCIERLFNSYSKLPLSEMSTEQRASLIFHMNLDLENLEGSTRHYLDSNLSERLDRLIKRYNETYQLTQTADEAFIAPFRKMSSSELRTQIEDRIDFSLVGHRQSDRADLFANLFFRIPGGDLSLDSHTKERVHYVPLRVRNILEFILSHQLSKNDTVMDIGSGLGRILLLIDRLTPANSIGVEQDYGLHSYSRELAKQAGCERIEFKNEDVFATDLSLANHFVVYSPMSGQSMRELVCRLGNCSSATVYAVGPCVREFETSKDFRPDSSSFLYNDQTGRIFRSQKG